MKKKFILLCLFYFYLLSNTALAVTYTPEVIIDAKYGDKDGEFGAYVDEGKGEGHYSSAPEAFCVDYRGNIFIEDADHRTIQKYDKNGKFLFNFGKDVKLSEFIFGIDGKGNLYVADAGNTCIYKFNNEGKYINKIGGKGKILKVLKGSEGGIEKIVEDGMFSEYMDKIYVSYNGDLYVDDPCHEKRYQKFNSDGKFIEKCDHFIEDIEGNEYVREKNHNLKKFRKQGNVKIIDNTFNMDISKIGTPQTQDYTFLGFDKKNNLYVFESCVFTGKYYTSGSTVYIFNKNGKHTDTVKIYPIETLPGVGGQSQNVNIDIHGNIYQLQQLKTGIQIIKWERKEGKKK